LADCFGSGYPFVVSPVINFSQIRAMPALAARRSLAGDGPSLSYIFVVAIWPLHGREQLVSKEQQQKERRNEALAFLTRVRALISLRGIIAYHTGPVAENQFSSQPTGHREYQGRQSPLPLQSRRVS
jgi:hypothetical protein